MAWLRVRWGALWYLYVQGLVQLHHRVRVRIVYSYRYDISFWQKATHLYHRTMIKKLRKVILVIWIILLIIFWVYVLLHPGVLHPEYLLSVFRSFGTWAIVLYILVSMFRSIILLPSLPLVVVWILYAPENPHMVYLISMCGIWFSWTLIYYFSHLVWLDTIFAEHVHSNKLKRAIEKYGVYIISFWSFFPILPVDVACYIAGTVRLPFIKYIIALTIGEWLVVGLIIYGWREIMKLFGI